MRDLLKTHSKWLDGGRRDTLSALTGATTMAVLWSQKSHGKAEDANDDDSSSSNHAGLASAPQPSYSEDAIMEEDTMVCLNKQPSTRPRPPARTHQETPGHVYHEC